MYYLDAMHSSRNTAVAMIRTPASARGIYGGQSDTGTGFSANTSIFPSVLYHQYSLLISVLKILLTKGQTGGAWGPSNKSEASTETVGHHERKMLICVVVGRIWF